MIYKTERRVDILGIDQHTMNDIYIGTAAGITESQNGPVILVMHQGAYHGKGHSIIAPTQLEAFGNVVDDKSRKFGGTQRISTPEGYVIPITIRHGLPYIPLRPCTNREWDTLPHIILTSDEDWEPDAGDYDPIEQDDDWAETLRKTAQPSPHGHLFDEEGDYRNAQLPRVGRYRDDDEIYAQMHFFDTEYDGRDADDPHAPRDLDDVVDDCILFHDCPTLAEVEWDSLSERTLPYIQVNQNNMVEATDKARTIKSREPDYKRLQPFFAWQSIDSIRKTLQKTTQYARLPISTWLKKRFRTPFPAANVSRRNEPIACDKIIADTPAIDSGATEAALFVGVDSALTDPYPIKSDTDIVGAFQDNIRERGAPLQFLSDGARAEIMGRIKDILRYYAISSWHSEPHHQHQNPTERRVQTVKHMTNDVMDRTGAPPTYWLLALMYVCFILNHTWNSTVNGIPLQKATGQPVDTSALFCFRFREPVYYSTHDDPGFPSEGTEERGEFVGFAENCGHTLTFRILTDDTKKVIERSRVRSALDPASRNLRLDPLNDSIKSPDQLKEFVRLFYDPPSRDTLNDGERSDDRTTDTPTPTTTDSTSDASRPTSAQDGSDQPSTGSTPPIFDPAQLVGRTFLMDEADDGLRYRARIVEAIDKHDQDLKNDKDYRRFRVSINDDEFEELLTYQQVMDHITSEENDRDDIVWNFRRIIAHEGPLRTTDPHYKGSRYNLVIEWETGERTSEPVKLIAKDDPGSVAEYAKERGLLDQPGFKHLRKIAKNQKKMLRMVNQAKLRSFRTAPRYKYGYEVPRDYNHAMELDEKNGNKRWQEAIDIELAQIDEYKTFQDLGKGTAAPVGYKKIRVHLVFDVKHDG